MEKSKEHTIDAEVTIKFVIENICESNYNIDEDMCFKDMVTERIEWDGIYSFLEEDDFTIMDVKKIQ